MRLSQAWNPLRTIRQFTTTSFFLINMKVEDATNHFLLKRSLISNCQVFSMAYKSLCAVCQEFSMISVILTYIQDCNLRVCIPKNSVSRIVCLKFLSPAHKTNFLRWNTLLTSIKGSGCSIHRIRVLEIFQSLFFSTYHWPVWICTTNYELLDPQIPVFKSILAQRFTLWQVTLDLYLLYALYPIFPPFLLHEQQEATPPCKASHEYFWPLVKNLFRLWIYPVVVVHGFWSRCILVYFQSEIFAWGVELLEGFKVILYDDKQTSICKGNVRAWHFKMSCLWLAWKFISNFVVGKNELTPCWKQKACLSKCRLQLHLLSPYLAWKSMSS